MTRKRVAPPVTPTRAPASDGSDAALDPRGALAAALEAEVQARRRLAQEVAALRQEVARLAALVGAPEPEAPTDLDADADSALSGAASFFDEALLLAEGLDANEVANLREAFEALELERLYLGDRAAREGWIRTPRYRQEVQALVGDVRDELGDEAYDAMLYAAGRNNRLRIGDILGQSPASRAGVETGDVVLRYDGRQVFNAQELRSATTQGQAGAATRLEVARDGRVLTLSLPRGPLGVRLVPTRRPPGR